MYNHSLRAHKKVLLCEDGTNTLFSEEFNEPYHSTKDGALNESLEKHVKPALAFHKNKCSLTILDICFGLGYNSFATIYYIQKYQLKTKVHILSPEFDEGLIRSLSSFDYPPEFDNIKSIIKSISEGFSYEDEQFKVEILLGDARVTVPKIREKVDIIYQDAFSPMKNPLLWTREFFSDISGIAKEDAILTTYSTAASTRLGLYENGFLMFRYHGEKTRASLIVSKQMLEGLEYIDMELKKLRNPTAKSLKDENYL